MDKYRLYIDESGTASFKNMNGNNKYLTLSGIIIKSTEVNNINFNLNRLKSKYFNYDIDLRNIILHREDIYNKRKGFEPLNDENVKNEFNKDLISFLENSTYHIIGVTINKESRVKKYKYPHDPYTTALETLIKRYVLFLEEHNSRGDILLESRNKNDNETLERIYQEIYNNGTKKNRNTIDIDSSRFQKSLTSKSLKFKNKSDNLAGLQIADLLANPLRNKLILVNEQINQFSDFSQTLYNKIENKIRSNSNGIRVGFGLVYCE
ncbi:MAG TPA: DUF3800 domain-containing protein [Candidatus Onthoplasma faecipullorum]|nr:DUF3800 domain-containing protein [Candidatus Onthoplasma faecipullorum]